MRVSPAVRLYDYAASANCFKVRLLLAQLGTPYERVPVDIFAGETLTDEFAAINPARTTPVLELESGRHLRSRPPSSSTSRKARRSCPTTRSIARKVLRWLAYEQTEVVPATGGLRFRLVTGRLDPGSVEAERRRRAGDEVLRLLDRHLAERAFAVRDRYSIADIALFGYVHVAGEAGFELRPLPRGVALDRASRRPAGARERPRAVPAERVRARAGRSTTDATLLASPGVLELFPASAEVREGALRLGGLGADELAERFGTPLVVLCERTLLERARAVRDAVPEATVFYGTKAFPNVAVMRLLAGEGIGADVSTLGELTFARAAGLEGEQLVLHGNNKSDEELRAAAEAGATVALDGLGEAARAGTAGVRRVLVRVTPGVDADTHAAIRTGQHGSKFGLPPAEAVQAVGEALEAGIDVVGLHAHVGSQLGDARAHAAAVAVLADTAVRARDELDWTPALVDCGGGFGVRHVPEEAEPDVPDRRRDRRSGARGVGGARSCPSRVSPSSPAARSSAGQADALPHRRREARGRRSPVGRSRRRHVRQPAPAALRRPLHGAAREPRGRDSGGRVRDRRQAPRVRRRPHRARRAARAAAGRPARRSGDRRLHARDGLELQRRAAAGCRARVGRRGAGRRAARDGRRPARPRGLARRR